MPTAPPPRKAPASPKSLPITDFIRHNILADGDCLFRSVLMGLAERPGIQASATAVADLRAQLAAYVSQHSQALAHEEVFRADNGLQNLYGLLLMPGAWADDTGDLVAPLLAQLLGREINILQPIEGNQRHYQVRQTFPPVNDCFPPADNPPGGGPLYLLQEHLSHYSYLEKTQSFNPSANLGDIDHAAALLIALGKTSAEHTSSSPHKKTKLTPKVETEHIRTPQAPLVSIDNHNQRFFFTTTVDLSQAQTYTDLRGAHAETLTSIPVGVISIADSDTMSRRPMVQDPDNPNNAHPEIPQPEKINPRGRVKSSHHKKHSPVLKTALERFDALLQNPQQRQAYERNNFALTQIEPKHLPSAASHNDQCRHPTLGMRGVIAQEPLTAGSPLQYSAQYLSEAQWQEATDILRERLQAEVGLPESQSQQEAARLLLSYSWEGITFNQQKYELSAFGAGNITAMINHDKALANMGVAYMPCLDRDGGPAPTMVVYFALKAIAKGEQLLVNYGEAYRFDTPAEGSMERLATVAEYLLNDVPSIKKEPLKTAATQIDSLAPLPISSTSQADTSSTSIAALPYRTSKRIQKYQQPPADYESIKGKKKSDLKAYVRKLFKRHHLTIPPWAATDREYVPKILKVKLPEKYQQPPEGYENLSAQEQDVICKRMRRLAKEYHCNVPGWVKLPKPMVSRPPLVDPVSLEQPADYEASNIKQKSALRARARKAAQLQECDIPAWAQEKYMPRSSALIKPEGFEDKMTAQQQSHYRASARAAAIKNHIPHPAWANKIRERRPSALEKPENYHSLSPQKKGEARAHAVRAAKNAGKPIPDWVIQDRKT